VRALFESIRASDKFADPASANVMSEDAGWIMQIRKDDVVFAKIIAPPFRQGGVGSEKRRQIQIIERERTVRSQLSELSIRDNIDRAEFAPERTDNRQGQNKIAERPTAQNENVFNSGTKRAR
jgi:hypothetical protein